MKKSSKAKLKAKLQKRKEKDKKVLKAKKKKAKLALRKDLKRAKKRAKYDLTLEELKATLPDTFGGTVNQQTLDLINKAIRASNVGEEMRNYIIGFSDVLSDGKYSVEQYLNAVKFASFKIMGFNNSKSYRKTFPDRYRKLVKKHGSNNVSPYVASYFKGKLVQAVLAQSITPPHLLYQDSFYKAVMKQTSLLKSKNEYVQQKAADSLMNHLTPPPETEQYIDTGSNGANMLNKMLDTLLEVSSTQAKLIKEKKVTAKQVIEGDYKTK